VPGLLPIALAAWALIAVECLLLYWLVRRHASALGLQRALRGRMTSLESQARELGRRLRPLTARATEPPYLYDYDPAGAPLLVEQPGAPRRPGAPILAGLTAGSLAPGFSLPDLDGRERSLAEFLGQPLLVVFFDPRSPFAARLAPELGRLPPGGPRLLLIGRGERSEHRRLARRHRWRADVLLDRERRVFELYRARGVPNGYLLDADGRVASSLAIGADEVLRLAAQDVSAPPDSYRQVLTGEAWLESAAAQAEQAAARPAASFLLAASISSGGMQELQQRWEQEKAEQGQPATDGAANREQAA
jgi:peroxiredoxin